MIEKIVKVNPWTIERRFYDEDNRLVEIRKELSPRKGELENVNFHIRRRRRPGSFGGHEH